jgi:uncharacterized YigZ family protein
MLEEFRTVKCRAEAEIVIRKSRFIGHVMPVASEAEAVSFIEEIKRKHADATHNCSAYVVGERDEHQKQSDDGEPSGTAGKPILEVIRHKELKNTAIVVTRYFGGILLGAGGLIRAYTDAAAAGIAAAGMVRRVLHREVTVTVDYTWYGKLDNELRNRGIRLGDTQFTDKVTVRCLPRNAGAEGFAAWLADLTRGQGDIRLGGALYLDHEISEPASDGQSPIDGPLP